MLTTRPPRAVIRLLIALILLTALVTPKTANATDLNFAQVDAYVSDLMESYQVPGVAVALIKDGQIVYAKGYGVRNELMGQPVTEHTVFAIGSISKSFTALAISQLVDSGKISLDD